MRLKTQFIFWISVYVILLLSFGELAGNYMHSFYFVSFFLPVVIATSVVFIEVLVEKHLLQKKYFSFGLYTFYLLIISLTLEMILVFASFILMSYYEPDNMGVVIQDFRIMPVIMYLIVFIYAFFGLFVRFISTQQSGLSVGNSTQDEYITIRSERKNRRVLCRSIVYIESMADYIRIFTSENERIISRQTISNLENILPSSFLRIHRSYIINLSYLVSYNREELRVSDKSLPISRTYKKSAIERLKSF